MPAAADNQNQIEEDAVRWSLRRFTTSFNKFTRYLRHSVITALLVVAAPTSSFVYTNDCSSSCLTWLLGTACRASLSFILLSLARLFADEPRIIFSIYDMIELVGILWFIYGNLLFLTNSICKSSCYYISLTYILGVHVFFFVPLFIRICTRRRRLTRQREREAAVENHFHSLGETRLVDHQIKNVIMIWLESQSSLPFKYKREFDDKSAAALDSNINFCPICLESFRNDRESAQEMPEKAAHTIPSYSMGGFPPSPSIPFTAPASSEEESGLGHNSSQRELYSATELLSPPVGIDIRDVSDDEGNTTLSNDAVVLSAAPAAVLVVNFPCQARHMFHLHCLLIWLQISFREHGQVALLTCPCCRSVAVSTTTS